MTHGGNSDTRATRLAACPRGREANRDTARHDRCASESDAWPGHLPGQHVDVRLTAEDGYQAQRSYSIASTPAAGSLDLTVEEIADGEVSPYLSEELRPGDRLELRGPIGGYFTWTEANGGPLLLVAGGSGVAPLMSMLRYREAIGSDIPATLLYSSRSWDEIIYREELDRLSADPAAARHPHADPIAPGRLGRVHPPHRRGDARGRGR